MKITVQKALTIVISVITIVGSLFAVEQYFAKASEIKYLAKSTEVKLVSDRLDNKILNDRLNAVQERIWLYLDRFGSIDKMPQSAKEEYRELLLERERMMIKLQNKS